MADNNNSQQQQMMERYKTVQNSRPPLRSVPCAVNDYSTVDTACSTSSSSAVHSVAPIMANLMPELALSFTLPSGQLRVIDNPNHAKECFTNLETFRHSSFLCDVEIKVQDRSFPCHRIVLASAIPYFKSMFSTDMKETRQREIEIKGIDCRAFDLLLQYAYKGKIHVTDDNAQPLLYAASILQMDHVCRACESFLTHYLTVDNCLDVRQFAEMHNCMDLMASVDQFVRDRFLELRTRDSIMQINLAHLIELIDSSDLYITSEEQVFETVVAWLEDDLDERLQYALKLIPKVRLTQLSVEYLINRVMTHPIIEKDPNCMEFATKSVTRKYIQCGFAPASSAGSQLSVWDDSHRPRKSVAGVIFCVGGRGTNGDPFRSVEAYDWRKDHWMAVAEMHTKRRHVGVIAAYGKLYAIGGHDGGEHLNSVEVFDPSKNVWKIVGSMEKCRRGIAVGFLEGAIYAVGGLDDTACFRDVERYNIRVDKWDKVAAMNVQRGGVGVAALGKYLYAVGGNDGTSSLDSCERFDPHLNEWCLVASMSHRRAGAGVTVLNGQLYAIGGFDDNAPLPSCERYDPEADAWQLIPAMSCPRGGVGVASMGGRLYAVGGHDGYHYLNSVEAYDPVLNKWQLVSNISQCRAGAGVAWCECFVESLLPAATVTVASCV